MDRTRLINKICPQLAEHPLWRELFEAIVDLADNGTFIESPFKDALRNRGYLKEFIANFVAEEGNIRIASNLPPGKYFSEEVIPLNSTSHIFNQDTQLFVGEPGNHIVSAIEFYPTEFYKTYLFVVGPETFSICSLATLMQAAYFCDVQLSGVMFGNTNYQLLYPVAELFSVSKKWNNEYVDEINSRFDLIAYSSDDVFWWVGDMLVLSKNSIDENPRKVLSCSNGTAFIEIPSGEDSIEDWRDSLQSSDNDTTYVARHFNGYKYLFQDLTFESEVLNQWFKHDAPIQIQSKSIKGFNVSPLDILLDFSKESAGASALISIAGNENFKVTFGANFTDYFSLTKDGVTVYQNTVYRAPCTMRVAVLNSNFTSNQNVSSLTFTTVVPEGESPVTYTVAVAQSESGCIVEIEHGSAMETVLILGNISEEHPMVITKNIPNNATQEDYLVRVKSILPFNLVAELTLNDITDTTDPATHTVLEWSPDTDDKLTLPFSSVVTPSAVNTQYEGIMQLPGFDPQMAQMGDTLVITIKIVIDYRGVEQVYTILTQTCNAKHLETLNKPMRVQGGFAFQALRRNSDGYLLASSEWGGITTISKGDAIGQIHEYANSNFTERGLIIKMSEFSNIETGAAAMIFFGCSDYTWQSLGFRYIVYSDNTESEWREVSKEGAELTDTYGVIVNKTSKSSDSPYPNKPVAVQIYNKNYPTTIPSISVCSIKWVVLTRHSNPEEFYVEGDGYSVLRNRAACLAILNTSINAGITMPIPNVYPGMNVQLPGTNRDMLVKTYKSLNTNRLLGSHNQLNADYGDSIRKIYSGQLAPIYYSESTSASPWHIKGQPVLEFPKGTIVVLCGFGTANFGTGQNKKTPVGLLGDSFGGSFDLLEAKAFPYCAYGSPFFTSTDYRIPSNIIWQGLVRTGVTLEGSTYSFDVSSKNPAGAWNCWYSGTIMLAMAVDEIGIISWDNPLLVNLKTGHWFGNTLSEVKQFTLYGYVLPFEDILTSLEISSLKATTFGGRTPVQGAVYAPLALQSGTAPYIANQLVEKVVGELMNNNYIDTQSLVQIPVSVNIGNIS